MLQNRPPLAIAIGSLRATDREHVQILLRMALLLVPIKCRISDGTEGDISITPAPSPDYLRIASGLGHVDLEHPVRLSPLADAVQALVAQLLEDGKSRGLADASGNDPLAADAPERSRRQNLLH